MARRIRPRLDEGQGVSVEAGFTNAVHLLAQFKRQRDYIAYIHPGNGQFQTSQIKALTMLAPAYPTPLSKSLVSNFGFYCWRKDGGFCFHNFHSAYAAKWFVEYVIDGHDFEWLDDNTIETEHGFKIKGERDSLERAVEYKPTSKEREWRPEIGHMQYYETFTGKRRAIDVPEKQVAPAPKPKKERKPVDEDVKVLRKKAKVKSGDYITISEICAELGHAPRECRQVLRNLKVEKPGHGWAWPPGEAAIIKKRISQYLK